LIRASIILREEMDCRVKLGNDEWVSLDTYAPEARAS
jgi:hypothetical protein